MKIMLVPAAYNPALGGTERTTQRIAESLAERGHQVTVAVADISSSTGYYTLAAPPTGRPSVERMNGVDIARLRLYSPREMAIARKARSILAIKGLERLAMKALKYTSRRAFCRRLSDLVDRLKPDAILTLPHLQPNVAIAADIALRRGLWLGIFPHIHHQDPDFPTLALAKVCRSADAVIAITHYERRTLITDYGVAPDRAIYSGLGTDVPPFDGGDHVRPDRIDILFVGRKTRTKGLDLLAAAVAMIDNAGDRFRVVLVGARAADTADIERRFLEHLSTGNFVSRDDVADEELHGWIGRCRLVVLPSKIESFGSVILEAWARKRPVVTLDLPVFQEIVDDGVDGLLVPPDDPAALSRAMADLITDEAKADRLGQAGSSKVEHLYTWPIVTDRIETCMAEHHAAKRA